MTEHAPGIRIISAEDFARAVRGGSGVDPGPAIVEGDLDLEGWRPRGRVRWHGMDFRGAVRLVEARVGQTLELADCKFARGLDLTGARIEGRLVLRDVEIAEDALLRQASIRRDLELLGVEVGGALRARNLRAGGVVRLAPGPGSGRRTTIAGIFEGIGIRVGADVEIDGAATGPVALMGARVQGTVMVHSGAVLGGKVSLSGAVIGGDAAFIGVEVAGDLKLRNARAGGDVLLRSENGYATRIGGELWLSRAKVLGDVRLMSVEVGRKLLLYGVGIGGRFDLIRNGAGEPCTIGEKVSLRGGEVDGDVRLAGTKVGGELSLRNAVLGRDLIATEIEVGGELRFSGLRVTGDADLRGIRVGGPLTMPDAELGGSLALGPSEAVRTHLRGPVRLTRARVRGNADLAGATFEGGLSLKGARIGGDLALCGGGAPTEVRGLADLEHAHAGSLALDRTLALAEPLRLTQTHLRTFRLVEEVPYALDAERLTYGQITVPGDNYRVFLDRTRPFRVGTYRALERWLRDQGEEDAADRVYQALRRKDRTEGMSLPRRAFDWLLDITIGHGTRSHRLAFYFLGAMALAIALFANPAMAAAKPRGGEIFTEEVHPTDWTIFDATWLAFRANFPMLSLLVEDDVEPSGTPVFSAPGFPTIRARDVSGALSVLSWLFFPLFLAGVSGLVRNQDEHSS